MVLVDGLLELESRKRIADCASILRLLDGVESHPRAFEVSGDHLPPADPAPLEAGPFVLSSGSAACRVAGELIDAPPDAPAMSSNADDTVTLETDRAAVCDGTIKAMGRPASTVVDADSTTAWLTPAGRRAVRWPVAAFVALGIGLLGAWMLRALAAPPGPLLDHDGPHEVSPTTAGQPSDPGPR